ncbi:MAG: hypothetical protein GF331_07260 [Chitinivibrionales bacterium]|nr:hypothetical protein [Chitinivibrionales bacterium]
MTDWWRRLACVLVCCMGVLGEQAGLESIAGPLPKVVKDKGRPYCVEADIEVPAGRMVTIEPGVVFLFKAFTGLHVMGRLEVNGTKAKPVVFTSVNDQTYNPVSTLIANPYDWNGIYVHADALGSTFEYVKVAYSVYGIMSETKFIKVEPGQFRENGKSNLSIEGVEHVTSTDKPYSYVLSTKDATVDGVPVKLLRDPAAPRRNTFRYVGLALMLGGAGVGVFETIRAVQADEELAELSNADITTEEGFSNLRNGSSAAWEDKESERTWSIVGAAAGYALGAAGTFGFGWSFTF